ncbi:uncharacterized protein LOC111349980 isoform X1 [Spodoptera litura]|uniref:Uncharacterized protein LOC111349980 isoform X1 n=1 Tax=Spodoptera litura TaxID=69820 RepID=A0A9J7DUE3_SPOLT|nr:uncharacterized protein LOC111349980 isoform X1 [Spodoptera litura]XP_022817121.1 uncharacterized protein LOC111349980 isoform X1 [Spodoptera litura]XP_022817122.1 uncharacterized protein LOC111349980 isoform X1 [Spodoptera litura]
MRWIFPVPVLLMSWFGVDQVKSNSCIRTALWALSLSPLVQAECQNDLKICKTLIEHTDRNLLQADLDAITTWCSVNRMSLNINKCYTVTFTRSHNMIQSQYLVDGTTLQRKAEMRDLGVIFDSKLTFLPHIDSIINKSSKMLGFIIRNSKLFRSPTTKITLYNSYVRSQLEYCSVVWSPQYNVHQVRVERIQKRFLRHLTFASGLHKSLVSYSERLRHFRMDRLTVRRKLLDITFMYKVLRNEFDCPPLLGLFNLRVPRRVPRRALINAGLLHQPSARTNLKRFSTISRLSRAYNSVCERVDLFSDRLPKFKKAVLGLLRDEA